MNTDSESKETTNEAGETITPPGEASPNWRWWDVLLISAAVILGVGLSLLATDGIGRIQDSLPIWLTSVLVGLAMQAITMGAAVTLVGMLRRRMSWQDAGLRPFPLWWLLVAAAAAVVLLPIRMAIGYGLQMLIDPTMENLVGLNESLFPTTSFIGFVLVFFFGGVLVPVVEELFFRGVLYKWLRDKLGIWPGVLISAVLFGAAHIYIPTAASAFVIGLVMAYMYEKSDSLWVPIAVHVTNNSIIFTMTYVALLLAELMGIDIAV